MAERFRLKTIVREIGDCKWCPACQIVEAGKRDPENSWKPTGKLKEVCAIAVLEKELGRVPMYRDLEKKEIKSDKIPQNCRNRYRSADYVPVSERK